MLSKKEIIENIMNRLYKIEDEDCIMTDDHLYCIQSILEEELDKEVIK